MTLAYCWSHFRRQFYEIAKGGNAPIADQALAFIARLYAIEGSIRRQPASQRQAARQQRTKSLVDELFASLEAPLRLVSKGSKIADAIWLQSLGRPAGLPRGGPDRDRFQHR